MQEEFPLHWIPSVLHRFVFLYLFVGFNEFLRADICICSSCFCHVSLILIYNSCLMPKSDLLTEPKAVEIAQLLCIFSVHPFLMSIFCDLRSSFHPEAPILFIASLLSFFSTNVHVYPPPPSLSLSVRTVVHGRCACKGRRRKLA